MPFETLRRLKELLPADAFEPIPDPFLPAAIDDDMPAARPFLRLHEGAELGRCGAAASRIARRRACRGDEHIGTKSNQVGDGSWQSIRGLGKTILDNQVSSVDPAVLSQTTQARID